MDKMPPKRCQFGECKIKLNISIPKCTCEKYFCSNHRHFTNHLCTYNKKDDNKELIKVIADKVIKI